VETIRDASLSVDRLIASTLRIPLEQVTGELRYHSIPQWDSFAHAELMGALERAHQTTIDANFTLKLTSVEAIRAFVASRELNRDLDLDDDVAETAKATRGLRNVALDESEITEIDALEGAVRYRGYDPLALVERSFEDVVHLLLRGELPTSSERRAFADELWDAGRLPSQAVDAVRAAAPSASALEALCTGLLAIRSSLGPARDEPADDNALRAFAALPRLLAIYDAARSGSEPVEPLRVGSYAANLLRTVARRPPSDDDTALLNRLLVLHADHELPASTLALRVAVGAGAGVFAGYVAAIATFSGHLHGGAIEAGAQMLDEFAAEEAEDFVRSVRAASRPLYGFGHGVYRGPDPRAVHLLEVARRLALDPPSQLRLRKVEALIDASSQQARYGIAPNEDLVTGVIYGSLGIPENLFVTTYCCARAAGWAAHALEQGRNNVLIRPRLHYVGPGPRGAP
jgi:citrate synthase